MQLLTFTAAGFLVGFIVAVLLSISHHRDEWQSGYDAAERQIRFQLERGHQQDSSFYLSEWPEIRFHPRRDRDGVNYEFEMASN